MSITSSADGRRAQCGRRATPCPSASSSRPAGTFPEADVGDTRESPALKIIRLLRELGAEVAYHDPHVPELPDLDLASVDLDAALAGADLVCIVTAHSTIDYQSVVDAAPLVVDFRGVTRGIPAHNVVRL
jgi:UDP-N-acetyl-D-glucosamine dehydrogenase